MKGTIVRISASFRMPEGWPRVGRVIAESDLCVGVKAEGIDFPLLVPKRYVAVVLT